MLWALILASAILQYSSSLSIPMKSNHSNFAPIPVVPLHANGSRHIHFLGVTSLVRYCISFIGLTVLCMFLFSLSFIINCICDTTLFAPRRNPRFPFIVVFNILHHSTFSTRLSPNSISQFTSGVYSFVIQGRNKFQISDTIVQFVSVFMMCLQSFRNWSVMFFSYQDVFKSKPLLTSISYSQISLFRYRSISSR